MKMGLFIPIEPCMQSPFPKVCISVIHIDPIICGPYELVFLFLISAVKLCLQSFVWFGDLLVLNL